MKGRGVEDMEGVPNAGAYSEGGDVGELTRELWGKDDEVVLADRGDLDGVCVLEVGGARVRVGGDQLLGRF